MRRPYEPGECEGCFKPAEFVVGQMVYLAPLGDKTPPEERPYTVYVCKDCLPKVRINRIDGERISHKEYFDLMYPDEKFLYGKDNVSIAEHNRLALKQDL